VGATTPRIAFAGDRDIAVQVLDHLLGEGVEPFALLLAGPGSASHAEELRARCPGIDDTRVLVGAHDLRERGVSVLEPLELDLVVCVHYPHIVPADVLAVPRRGFVNLHPAYLPANRGWHTPTWALLDDTPIGATLHYMASEVDAGPVVHQQRLEPSPGDTAHTLYSRLKALELEVFRAAWPALAAGDPGTPQDLAAGTIHGRRDLERSGVRRVDLDELVLAGDLIRRLRALTTDRAAEAAYFDVDGRRYLVQVHITEVEPDSEAD
jgi:methionyl-tRNA formyltransferase